MIAVKFLGAGINGIPLEISEREAPSVASALSLIREGIAPSDRALFDKAKILLNRKSCTKEELLKDGDELFILPYLGSG